MTKLEKTSGLGPVTIRAAKNASDERTRAALKALAEQQAAGSYFPRAGMPLADYAPLEPTNTLEDNGDGQFDLLPRDQHDVGLKVILREWTMHNSDWQVQFAIDKGQWGPLHTVSPGFSEAEFTVDLGNARYQHGIHTVHLQAQSTDDFNMWPGGDAQFHIDIHNPNMGQEPDRPFLPTNLDGGVITPDYLNQHNGVTFTIPRPQDHKIEDTCTLSLNDNDILVDQPFADPFEITVPRDVFDSLQSGVYLVRYKLTDRAGNATDYSQPERVVLTKSDPPVLQAPEIPQGGAISLEEARAGVTVWHNYATPEPGDIVTVTWLTEEQDSYIVPVEYKDIPFAAILKPGRVYSGEVVYEVNRGGAVYKSPPTQIDVDLEHTGPVNPDEPDTNPVNPDLEVATLVSSTGNDNTIEPADKGQDATITVPLYTGAAVGEMIQVYYGDAASPVGAPRALDAADLAADEITVNLLWSIIHDKGNGTIRLFYRIYPAGKPENWQQSPDAEVVVSVNVIDDLPVATFPDRHPIGEVINCDNAPWLRGVNVLMAYPTLEEDDLITIHWVLDSTFVGVGDPVPTTPVEETRRAFVHRVTATEEAAGEVLFNVRWGDHLSAVTRGSIVVYWHLSRNEGAMSGTSPTHYVRYALSSGGQSCVPTA